MSFKIKLLFYLASVVLFEWVGSAAFSACRGNDGSRIICAVAAYITGGVKTFVAVASWFLYALDVIIQVIERM